MDNRIFHINESQQLVSMEQQEYDSEDLLQVLLASHPELLASDQIGDEPRRWLLISRETPIPDQEDYSSGRWSLDHLFLDQDGIPTLVEVKRSSDTRIRREVVGQLLDYAANAVAYWRLDEIRARFEVAFDDDSDEELLNRLGILSPHVFWQTVETNLRAGKIRMIFVADEIPDELRRIVEFLNEQMSPAEVIAIAIRQYVGSGLQTLVPTLYGDTAKARGSKSNNKGNKWTKETFFPELTRRKNERDASIARQILEWAENRELYIWWGEGKQLGSFIPMVGKGDHKNFAISVWTNGLVEVQFQYMLRRPPFDSEALRHEYLMMLNAINGISLPEDSLARRPSFDLAVLADGENLERFLAVLDWLLETVHSYYEV